MSGNSSPAPGRRLFARKGEAAPTPRDNGAPAPEAGQSNGRALGVASETSEISNALAAAAPQPAPDETAPGAAVKRKSETPSRRRRALDSAASLSALIRRNRPAFGGWGTKQTPEPAAEAAPEPPPGPEPRLSPPDPATAEAPHLPLGQTGPRRQLTVRLDPTHYRRFRDYKRRKGQSNQEILTEAIRAYLDTVAPALPDD